MHHRGRCGGGHNRCTEKPCQDPIHLPPSPGLATPTPPVSKQGADQLPLPTQEPTVGQGLVGMLTAWPAAHLVQAATGTGEADDDGDHGEHKDGQADGHSCSKPAREPVLSQGRPPHPGARRPASPLPRSQRLTEGQTRWVMYRVQASTYWGPNYLVGKMALGDHIWHLAQVCPLCTPKEQERFPQSSAITSCPQQQMASGRFHKPSRHCGAQP